MSDDTPDPVHVLVTVERDEDGYPPFDAEELDAVEVEGGRYRVTSAPTFVHGIAADDVVRVVAVQGEEGLWVAEVVEESGHWVARLVTREPTSPEQVVAELEAQGCGVHLGRLGVVVVDVPPDVDPRALLEHLRAGEAEGRWFHDLGVGPPTS